MYGRRGRAWLASCVKQWRPKSSPPAACWLLCVLEDGCDTPVPVIDRASSGRYTPHSHGLTPRAPPAARTHVHRSYHAPDLMHYMLEGEPNFMTRRLCAMPPFQPEDLPQVRASG